MNTEINNIVLTSSISETISILQNALPVLVAIP